MARNLKDLSKRLRKLNDEIANVGNDAAVQAAETILAELTVKTPVDTTKAISNWQVSLNGPAEGYLDPYVPGKHGSTWSESAAAAYEAGKKVLLNKKAGDSIHITNNAPYIKRLNEGYSSQAPAGFVERVVMLGRKISNKVKITIKV